MKIAELSFRNKILEEERCKYVNLNDELQQELISLKGLVDDYKEKESQLKEVCQALERDSKALRQREKRLKEEEQKMKQKLETIAANFEIQMENNEKYLQTISLLEKEQERLRNVMSSKKEALKVKEKEVFDLTNKLSALNVQLKEYSKSFDKKLIEMNQKHQCEIKEVKEENIEQEKQLRKDYEERIALQIREKDESMKQIKLHFEELLTKLAKERDEALDKLKQNDSDRKKLGSVENLQCQIQDELQTAEALDNSLLGYFEKENSLVSSTSTDVAGPVEYKVQQLATKVLQEGIHVLSLTDRIFLHNNSSMLSESQQSILNELKLSQQDGEVAQNDSEMVQWQKRERRALLIKMESEKMLREEWQSKYEREKSLSEQLKQQLQTVEEREERAFSWQNQLYENREKLQILETANRELESALTIERNNFSRISMTLDHERKLATRKTETSSKFITDLRNDLENERFSKLELKKQLRDLKQDRNSLLSSSRSLNNSLSPSISSVNLNEKESICSHISELSQHSEVDNSERMRQHEQELLVEKQRNLDLQLMIETLRQEMHFEKAKLTSDLSQKQDELSALKKSNLTYKAQERNLHAMIESREEKIEVLERKLSEMSLIMSSLKQEIFVLSSTKTSSPLNVEEKEKLPEDNQLNKEVELEQLRNRVLTFEANLKKSKEKEIQLQSDLETEREMTKIILSRNDAVPSNHQIMVSF